MKGGVATPYGTTKRASRKNDWKFSPAAFFGREPLRVDLHALDDLLFAVIKVSPEELPRALPPRDGAYLTHRLRAALLGTERALEA
jgi:hypothetical protein